MDKKTAREQGIGTMSKSMLVVMILTMGSKVAGFLREAVLASHFGATIATDAYKTAELVPCMFLSILVTALCSTLIPAYSSQLGHGQERANRFINNLFTVGTLLSVAVLLLTAVFIEPITNFVTQESGDAETRRLAVELARLMMPMGIFVFLARITSAYLQANFNFTVPAISQLFLNLVIVGAIMLSRGANIAYVAAGTVLGWALQFLVQLPAVRRTGLRYRPVVDFREPGLREVLFLMVPVLISSAFDQLYITFDKMVVLRGAVGDLTALDYANRIGTMVSAVLLTTIATVLYPNLVRHADDRQKMTDDLSFGINLNLLIAIPATIAIILLSLPITSMVYQRGEFSADSTLLTASILACYAAGIFGVGLRELCNRCFFAYKDTRLPMVVGVAVVLLNIGLNYALHAVFGPAGIAAATAISSTVSGMTLLLLLRAKHKVFDGPRVLRCAWRVLAATGAMAAVVLALGRVFGLASRTGAMALLPGMLVTCMTGVAVYAGVLLLLKTEELTMLLGFLRNRLRRSS